jgi:hypothetical protein
MQAWRIFSLSRKLLKAQNNLNSRKHNHQRSEKMSLPFAFVLFYPNSFPTQLRNQMVSFLAKIEVAKVSLVK